ncbi:ComEA family DNA-binding protein [Streptococcus henryi]|uniref:ComEA family DNA-binding protein n=1 Tax=Streptococcus henryi TaxID=439219 RepID=UPI00036DDCDE|nr:ComEA family DNA-binding protein [Streptococcus henryi]
MCNQYLEKYRKWISGHQLLTGLLGSLLVMATAFVVWTQVLSPQEEQVAEAPLLSLVEEVSNDKVEESAEERPESSTEIMVDIKGAVKKEGVYSLAVGSRVTDVIRLAGGFTAEADKKSVNLAQKLTDEEVIYVATVDEDLSLIETTANRGENPGTSKAGDDGKVNLNTASAAELQAISGIGEKRAQDIIAYREAEGGFTSVDELINVSGIGAKTLERLKTEVCID